MKRYIISCYMCVTFLNIIDHSITASSSNGVVNGRQHPVGTDYIMSLSLAECEQSPRSIISFSDSTWSNGHTTSDFVSWILSHTLYTCI